MRVVRSLDELPRLPSDRRVNGFRGRVPLALEIPEDARPAQLRAQDSLIDCRSAAATSPAPR